MAQAFNLVARLQLQGPQNIQQVVNRIQSRLNSIQANVALNIPAGASSRLKTFNASLTQTNSLLQQVTNNANAAAAALTNVASGMKATGVNAQAATKAATAASTQMKSTATNTKLAATEMAEFGRISALAVRRFLAFSIPAGLLVGMITSIKSGVRAAIDFEREMVRVQQVTGRTAEGLRGLTTEISRLSTTFGAASGELAEVSRTLAQAGLTARQTKTALEAIAKTDLSPTFDSMKQTTEGAIAAMRQFGIAAESLEGKLGSMNAVAGSFAVESADIISAIRRTGGAFKAAGGSLEELIALFTSVRATTRESADSIATGFRTIFTRLQRPRTIQFLRDFNIELQQSGKFVGPYEAIKRLSAALKELDPRDVRFSRITEELGGFRQVSKVIPLIQQFATAQQAYQVALAGTESTTQDAALAQSALAVQLSKVSETWQTLYRDITGSPIFKGLAESALVFARALADTLRQLKSILPLLLTIGGIKAIGALRQFGTGFGGGLISSARGAQKFARGGMVPGSGSGDTVPAMLQPGEFVLRKSAVKAIGAHNLSGMNVRKYARGTAGAGVAPLSALETKELQMLRGKDFAKRTAKEQKRFQALNVRARARTAGLQNIAVDVGGTHGVAFLSNAGVSGQPRRISTSLAGLRKESSDAASMVQRKYPASKYNVASISSSPSMFSTTPGAKAAFEGQVIKPLGGLLKNASQQALGLREFQSIPFENLVSKVGFRSTVGNLFESYVRAATKTHVANNDKEPIFDIQSVGSASNFKGLFGSTITKGVPLEIKTGKTVNNANLIGKMVRHTQGSTLTSISTGGKKFARGGRATDTVPAMLTPGEFVMNRSAAQSIGYGNLNAMNKTRGYAHGGAVQGFARGGNVGKGAGGGLLSVVLLSSFAQTMNEGNKKMQEMIATVTKVIIAFEGARLAIGAFQGIAGTLAGGFGGGGRPGRGRVGLARLGRVFTGNPAQRIPIPGSAIGATRIIPGRAQARVFGGGSQLNQASKALTGFSAGLVGVTAVVAAATTAFLYFGQKADEQANELAESARSEKEFRKATDKARTAGTLKKTGYGLAAGAGIGAAIGSIVPGIGTAIGAAAGAIIGGVGGAIWGASDRMEARMKELRKIQRESIFTEASEGLTQNLQTLLSGDIRPAGSRQLGESEQQLRAMLDTFAGARADADVEEALARKRGITNVLPQLAQLRTSLIAGGASMEDFTKEGTTGAQIVKAFALVQKESTFDIRQAIEKEIDARDKAIEQANKFQANIVEMNNSLRVLREFGSAMTDMTHRLTVAASQIEVLSKLARGQAAIGEFVGRPGIGDFSRIGKEGIVDRPQFLRAIDQVIGGEFAAESQVGKATQQRLRDLTLLMDEIPGVLSEIARDPALSKEAAGARFRTLAEARFKGRADPESIERAVTAIEAGITTMVNAAGAAGGIGTLQRLGKEDPQALFAQLGGKILNKNFEELDRISAGMIASVKRFDTAVRTAVEMEIAIYQRRMAFERQAFKDIQTITGLRAPGAAPVGVGVHTAHKGRMVARALEGTRGAGGDPLDVVTIGRRLKAVNDEIKALNQHRQTLTILDKGFIEAQTKMSELNVESIKLRTALESLRNVTDEAAQIQKTLNMLEEQKKARFGLAERYTFGTREDRQKILRTILDTVRVTSGGVDIDKIPGERRGAIQGIIKEFQNVQALMFGLDPRTGKTRTGKEAGAGIVGGRVGRIGIPDFAQALFGPDLRAQMADVDPTKLNPAQEKQVALLETLFERRATAEDQFIQNMESQVDKLGDTIRSEFATFTATLVAELTLSARRGAERQFKGAEDALKGGKELLDKAQMAQDLVIGAGGPATTTKSGAIKLAGALANVSDDIKKISRVRALAGVVRELGRTDDKYGRDVQISRQFGTERRELERFGTRTKFRGLVEKELLATTSLSTMEQVRGRLEKTLFADLEAAGARVGDDIKDVFSQRILTAVKGRDPELFGSRVVSTSYQHPHPTYGGGGTTTITSRTVKTQGQAFDEFVKMISGDLSGKLGAQSEAAAEDIAKGIGQKGQGETIFNLIADQNVELLSKLAGSFAELNSENIEALPSKVQNLTIELEQLGKVLDSIPTAAQIKADLDAKLGANRALREPAAVPPVARRALGGPMFKQQGTDTVPAMLTPGEFVVNREAAQANMGLLRALNRGDSIVGRSGTLYAQGGGAVPEDEQLAALLARLSPSDRAKYLKRQQYQQGKKQARARYEATQSNKRKAYEAAHPNSALTPAERTIQRRESEKAMRELKFREKKAGYQSTLDGLVQRREGTRDGSNTAKLLDSRIKNLQAMITAPMPVPVQPKTYEERLADAKSRVQRWSLPDPFDQEKYSEAQIAKSLEFSKAALSRLEERKKMSDAKLADVRAARKARDSRAPGIYLGGELVTPENRDELIAASHKRLGIDKLRAQQEARKQGTWLGGMKIIKPGDFAGKTQYSSGYFDSTYGRKATSADFGRPGRDQTVNEEMLDALRGDDGLIKISKVRQNLLKRQLELKDPLGPEARKIDKDLAMLRDVENRQNERMDKLRPWAGRDKALDQKEIRDYLISTGQMKAPTTTTPGKFRIRRPPGSRSAYDARHVRVGDAPPPGQLASNRIREASDRLSELKEQAEDFKKLRELLNFSNTYGGKGFSAIPGVDATPRQMLELTQRYGQVGAADLMVYGKFKPVEGDEESRRMIRHWSDQLAAQRTKAIGEYNHPRRAAGREVQRYANELGLGHLPLGLQMKDLTKEQSEALRAKTSGRLTPATFSPGVGGRGGRINIAPNKKYWEERPGLLERAARHEFAHALDYHIGGGTRDGKAFAGSQDPRSLSGSWLRDPRNVERWQRALFNQRISRLPAGANRIAEINKYSSSYHFKNPKEIFAQLMAGGTPEVNRLRDELLSTIAPQRFHHGGMVPGTGEQAAILQGGEFVLSKSAVQALSKGGMVKGYQDGGSVTNPVGGDSGGITVSLSNESISALASAGEALKTSAESVKTTFSSIPGQIQTALADFPAQLDNSAQIINEASAGFQAGAATMQESLQTMPAEIATALNETSANLVSSSQVLSESITGLSTAVAGFNDGVAQMTTTLAAASESMRGAAMEIRDALAQEVQINVTVSHDPITVTVDGVEGAGATAGGPAWEAAVMEVVGPEIDSVVNRMRETGFGIA